ncbi:MAG: site-2 protease family protein [Ruminococcaceae bacterium]|nr:site-2 protease family protein [Oscillospiraceae bacterium]
MIFDLLRGGFELTDLIGVLVTIPVVLLSLSFHELAHGYVAMKLGDPTARYYGRITMNPLKHLDPIGALSMLFFGIGWAKPVPINPMNFRNPKKGMALTGLAGPVSNLILSFVGTLLYRICIAVCAMEPVALQILGSRPLWLLVLAIQLFLWYFSYMNAMLAIFNLIPVPPFDGSRIFYFILPDKYYFSVMKYERIIMTVTLVLLFTGALDKPLSFATEGILTVFHFIIGLVPFL